jgi:ankyrin repeat protein
MFERLFKKKEKAAPAVVTCPDCGVSNGELYDLFCTNERCPFCEGQLCSCDCLGRVLKLSEEETRAVDEYVDDSKPPLSDIMRRWKSALDEKGRVPFYAYSDDPIRAAYRGDKEVLLQFFSNGFQANYANSVGYTALMAAARGEALEVIRLLLSKGASASWADKRGYTALHWAVAQSPVDATKQVSILGILIDAGADVNSCNEEGITPLMNAAWFGCDDSVRKLLSFGAVLSVRDKKGRSAHDLAVERGHSTTQRLLE